MKHILFYLLLSQQILVADPGFGGLDQNSTEFTVNAGDNELQDSGSESGPEEGQEAAPSEGAYPTSLSDLSDDTLERIKKPLDELNLAPLSILTMPEKFDVGMVEGLKSWKDTSLSYSTITSNIEKYFDKSWTLIDEKEGAKTLSTSILNSKEYFAYRLEAYAQISRIVEKLTELKKDLETSPELAKTLIANFEKYLKDTDENLDDAIKTLKDQTSDESLLTYQEQAQKNAKDLSFGERDALKSWKELLKNESDALNPVNWSFDKNSPLVGQTLIANTKFPYVMIYNSKLKNAKRYASTGSKPNKDKYETYLKGSLLTKSSSGKQKMTRAGYSYKVESIAKDGNGKVLGYVVRKISDGKAVGQSMLIPHDVNTSTLPLKIKIKSKKPKFSSVEEVKQGDFKIPSFTFLVNLLKETSTQIEALELGNEDAAGLFKKNAYAVYQYCFYDRSAIKAYSQKELKSLLDLIASIENSINIHLNQGIAQRISKQKAIFEVGTTQNILAICASIICENYKFDEQSKNIILGNYAVDANVVRIGNFFAKGTNNKDEVESADGVMSGQYSLIKMTPRAYMTDVTIDLYYKGLNPSSKGTANTNDYAIYALNPAGSGYQELLKCISTLNTLDKNGWTGYYKKPIRECINDQTKDAFFEDSSGELAYATVNGVSGKSSGMIDGITFNPLKKDFVIYQEAAGLAWAQDWVDYDEATMTAGMRIRKLEKVKKENFRIVLDGSGTMGGVFEKVIEGLETEFKSLKVPSLMNLKTTSLFGIQENPSKYKTMMADDKKNNRKERMPNGVVRPAFLQASKGPISLSDLKLEKPGGPSPLLAGMKRLITAPANNGGIPKEPWILAIISDFQSTDKFFSYNNWVNYFARNPIDGQKISPLFRRSGRDGNYRYSINQTAGSTWENLQEVQLISVNGIIQAKTIKVADWMTKDPYFKKGDRGIYLFDQMTPQNFKDAMSKFMQPIKESVQGRSK